VSLRLFDTLTRQLVPVEPLEHGHVRIYTCGPTVWNRVHIGNMRTFVFEDVLRRWLDHRFARVTHVMNLTDVDDRIINNAREHGHSLDEETAPWIATFFEDRDILGIRPAHHYPRATEYIEQMVGLVERLVAAGAAYESEGSYYFHIAAFPEYGKLSGFKAEGLVAGASGRVDADDYDKRNIRDFALWKAVQPDEIGWDSRIGRGRPGWHIECSAMSMTLLGETIDIHCGGVDNIFPHHENEIAQSEAATHTRFVRQWCHSAHLLIDLEKMAKRTGNFLTVGDVVADGHRPAALRYMLAATSQYRREVNYSPEPLAASQEAVDRLVAFRDRVRGLQPNGGAASRDDAVLAAVREARRGFEEAMDDDLNLPEAMGAVFTGVREANRILDTGPVSADAGAGMQQLVDEVDDILGVLELVDRDAGGALSAEEQELLDARARARAAGDYAESDRLRDVLAERGIVVEDTPQGQRWRRR